MKKISFLFLIFISTLKIESASHISLYSHEYSNKTNVECVYTPTQTNFKKFLPYKSLQKEIGFDSISQYNFHVINKFSLLYYNKYIIHRLKLHRYPFTFSFQFIKIPQGNIFHQTADEEPLRLS